MNNNDANSGIASLTLCFILWIGAKIAGLFQNLSLADWLLFLNVGLAGLKYLEHITGKKLSQILWNRFRKNPETENPD